MTTHCLDTLFNPQSIALIGASRQAGSVGAVLAHNLLTSGYKGALHLINSRGGEIDGHECIPSIDALSSSVDLAVIATPASTVPLVLEQLATKKCRSCIIISAGLKPSETQNLVSVARTKGMRLLGPNCLGLLSPSTGVNASFSHALPSAGGVAFLTQSGAIATSLIDWAISRNIGFSRIVSMGDMGDLDFGDLLDYLATDPETRSVLIYAESITNARKFLSAGRRTGRDKPIFILKAGKSEAGAHAAASHTGAMAGSDVVHDAAFPRGAMVRLDTLRDLYGLAQDLSACNSLHTRSVTVLTNGGGLGVLAADAAAQFGVHLPPLSEGTVSRLDPQMPPSWSRANPIDMLGDAHQDRYEAAIEAVSDTGAPSTLLALNCPTGVADRSEAAMSVASLNRDRSSLSLMSCWTGGGGADVSRARLRSAGASDFETPEEAIRVLHLATSRSRAMELSQRTPPPNLDWDPNRTLHARAVFQAAKMEGRLLLTEDEAKALLEVFDIPVCKVVVAATPAMAADAAERTGFPVALKILSKSITHKSDVGGVRLALRDRAETLTAAHEMLEAVSRSRPDAGVEGFTIQPMISKPLGCETIIGSVRDPVFGACLLFGHGGVATETIADRSLALAPLDLDIALDMIRRTRISRLLAGYRHVPPAKVETIARALCSLSDLMISLPEIAEVDVNPLLVDDQGAIGLDARIRLRDPSGSPPDEDAIAPWPEQSVVDLMDGQLSVVIRPALDTDASHLVRSDWESVFLDPDGTGAMRPEIQRPSRAEMSDFDREATLVALISGAAPAACARVMLSQNRTDAGIEFLRRPDCPDVIANALCDAAIAFAASRGADRLHATLAPDGVGRRLADRRLARYQPSGVNPSLLSAVMSVARDT